ncbi:hypothetical protein V8F33_006552 [Rhypophila sp. PSN 637]
MLLKRSGDGDGLRSAAAVEASHGKQPSDKLYISEDYQMPDPGIRKLTISFYLLRGAQLKIAVLLPKPTTKHSHRQGYRGPGTCLVSSTAGENVARKYQATHDDGQGSFATRGVDQGEPLEPSICRSISNPSSISLSSHQYNIFSLKAAKTKESVNYGREVEKYAQIHLPCPTKPFPYCVSITAPSRRNLAETSFPIGQSADLDEDAVEFHGRWSDPFFGHEEFLSIKSEGIGREHEGFWDVEFKSFFDTYGYT